MPEKHSSAASHVPTPRVRGPQPGTCPNWELNPRPFPLQDDTQPMEPCRSVLYIFKNNFLNTHLRICVLILERQEGEGGERERETLIGCFCMHPSQGSNFNLGMCPHGGSNLQHFCVQDNALTNQSTWPGQKNILLY